MRLHFDSVVIGFQLIVWMWPRCAAWPEFWTPGEKGSLTRSKLCCTPSPTQYYPTTPGTFTYPEYFYQHVTCAAWHALSSPLCSRVHSLTNIDSCPNCPVGCALYPSLSTTCFERCPCCANASQSSRTVWKPSSRSYVTTATGEPRREQQRQEAIEAKRRSQQRTTAPDLGARGAEWLGGDVWGSWRTAVWSSYREWETLSEDQAGRASGDEMCPRALTCVPADILFLYD